MMISLSHLSCSFFFSPIFPVPSFCPFFAFLSSEAPQNISEPFFSLISFSHSVTREIYIPGEFAALVRIVTWLLYKLTRPYDMTRHSFLRWITSRGTRYTLWWPSSLVYPCQDGQMWSKTVSLIKRTTSKRSPLTATCALIWLGGT